MLSPPPDNSDVVLLPKFAPHYRSASYAAADDILRQSKAAYFSYCRVNSDSLSPLRPSLSVSCHFIMLVTRVTQAYAVLQANFAPTPAPQAFM